MSDDEILAMTILDRLRHDSHVINIRGERYRLREKRKCGVIRSQSEQPH